MRALAVVGVVLLLAGCASTPPAEVPNLKPCLDFEEAAGNMLSSFTPEGNELSFDLEVGNVRSASLAGEGDVKEAMRHLVDQMPDQADLMMNESSRSRYNSLVQNVVGACGADGVIINPGLWAN